MSDIDMLTAVGEGIKVDGKKYRLGVMDRTDWALVNERILSLRGDPIAIVEKLAPNAPEKVAAKLYEKAYDDAIRAKIISARDFDEFVYSVAGQNFVFWLRMKKHDPAVDETEASRVLAQWSKEAFASVTDKLMQRFPKMTREEVETAQLAQEDDILNKMVSNGLGMPEGNPATPEKPGTPTSP